MVAPHAASLQSLWELLALDGTEAVDTCMVITCTAVSFSPVSLKESPARSQLFLKEMWEVRAQLQTCHDGLAELIRPLNLRSTAVLLLPFMGGKSVMFFASFHPLQSEGHTKLPLPHPGPVSTF